MVPLWLQHCIYPLIESTAGCYYCIFIRGVVTGMLATLIIGGATWAVYSI